MSYKNLPVMALLIFLLLSFTNRPSDSSKSQVLFNGKDLTGWDTYLGPKYDTILKKRAATPIGLNIDHARVFSVVDMGGEKVIRISGENLGGISTTAEFENYHLQLQFKWGQLRWAPRKTGKRDSGLLYDAVGPQGADGGNWMRSHEFQIQEGDCGDYWGCAGATADIKAKKNAENLYVYNKNGDLLSFGLSSPNGRRCVKYPNSEKPSGEWNTIDLFCFGNTSIHMVNGVVNMVLHNSRQIDNGRESPLTKGKIQIQSEGAEIYYRNIQISSIKKLPAKLVKE